MLEGKVPTTATSASVIAALQVQEAVKLLHRDRLAYDFAGKGFAYNGLTHDSYVVNYPRREHCQSHDSYDLDGAESVSATTTFGDLLQQARLTVPDCVLDLEHEVVLALECAPCGISEPVHALLERLSEADAVCPQCKGERRPVSTHSVSGEHLGLLALTPVDLGLPRFDVLTVRAGTDGRRHLRLYGDDSPFDELVSG
jgi:adenylyltransferase/sulfurtransferase